MYVYEELQQQLLKYGNLQNLMKYFTEEELKQRHKTLKRNKATGIDRVTKTKYEANLDVNIHNLVSQLKNKSYFPRPSLRHTISKSNGKVRCLGIPAYEDKIVQGVMSDILVSIYEPIFCDNSFGYRHNRNCHQALGKLNKIISRNKTKYIIEADIKGFFDNINHQQLITFLQYLIKDKVFIMYVKRFLNNGVLHKGHFMHTTTGTPQGGIISPILANIYLHYVLDNWFETYIKLYFSNCELIRYCDDFIICCSCYNSAKTILNSIHLRFAKYGLQLEPSKTKVIKFDPGSNTSDNFKFLGFNVGIINHSMSCTTYLSKTIQKQEYITNVIMQLANTEFHIIANTLNNFLRGNYQYYAISTNMSWVGDIYSFTIYELYRILCYSTYKNYTPKELDFLLTKFPIKTPPPNPVFAL